MSLFYGEPAPPLKAASPGKLSCPCIPAIQRADLSPAAGTGRRTTQIPEREARAELHHRKRGLGATGCSAICQAVAHRPIRTRQDGRSDGMRSGSGAAAEHSSGRASPAARLLPPRKGTWTVWNGTELSPFLGGNRAWFSASISLMNNGNEHAAFPVVSPATFRAPTRESHATFGERGQCATG